ncbi:microcin C ABC transporter permease YejB [Varunaivibrio sulfuroxidans]|uniref:Microcin C transport system permease protein n=1 Tax=Varunaivibrio sulfuroxidans TaxID=1773489 RepID=A0A4R3JFX2_9PROT|nr:microcin C ABC transporter permease YejB [Varunaivibrio sulfuroxidans]TCS65038.1 microcin C transport system permease protein [Varunaivibrio sulfuroxidans]WES29673.1 microcin C ABC transporter permease YejB [Varunaivibrio sulfuroxidans]
MLAYIIRRLALMVPTLLGIMVINFAVAQVAPGGPVEQMIAKIKGETVSATARFASGSGGETQGGASAGKVKGGASAQDTVKYRGAQGLDPGVLREIEVRLGFDKPPLERFWLMMKSYLTFDFGKSFYSDRTVSSLLLSKMPVSISLGLWTTLLVYMISIPLGIAKAVRDGNRFDVWTSVVIIVGYAIPGFLFAILLVVLFAGGSFLDWFPLRGLTSPNWAQLDWPARIADYFWHITLPILSMVIGGFAGLTMLTKNSFMAEIDKQYVVTARAKGLTERRVLYGHVFRNAMLLVIAGFPGAFIGILFTGAMLTEIIFSLDGLGLLGFEAIVNRDYPVMFASLYLFTLLGLLLNLVSDLTYHMIDPRIDFESRGS